MNNKKYHFVKVGLVNDPTYNGTWYFKPETKEDVDEHWNKYVSINYIHVHDGYTLNGWPFDYEEMFDKYTFADGTPFGIKKD